MSGTDTLSVAVGGPALSCGQHTTMYRYESLLPTSFYPRIGTYMYLSILRPPGYQGPDPRSWTVLLRLRNWAAGRVASFTFMIAWNSLVGQCAVTTTIDAEEKEENVIMYSSSASLPGLPVCQPADLLPSQMDMRIPHTCMSAPPLPLPQSPGQTGTVSLLTVWPQGNWSDGYAAGCLAGCGWLLSSCGRHVSPCLSNQGSQDTPAIDDIRGITDVGYFALGTRHRQTGNNRMQSGRQPGSKQLKPSSCLAFTYLPNRQELRVGIT